MVYRHLLLALLLAASAYAKGEQSADGLLQTLAKVTSFHTVKLTLLRQVPQASLNTAALSLLPARAGLTNFNAQVLVIEGRCLLILGSYEINCWRVLEVVQKGAALVKEKLDQNEDLEKWVGGLGGGAVILLIVGLVGLLWRARQKKRLVELELVCEDLPSTSTSSSLPSV